MQHYRTTFIHFAENEGLVYTKLIYIGYGKDKHYNVENIKTANTNNRKDKYSK